MGKDAFLGLQMRQQKLRKLRHFDDQMKKETNDSTSKELVESCRANSSLKVATTVGSCASVTSI